MKDDTYRVEALPQPWVPCWGILYHARRCDGTMDRSGYSWWPAETSMQTRMTVTLTNIRGIERDLTSETKKPWTIVSVSPPIWLDVDPGP